MTEYFPSICFKTYIENFPNVSLESQSIIFKQLYSCLKHLKQNYIVHCDFNINNILINPSSLEIKLIDFGCAELFTKNSIISPKGNPDFRIRTTKNFELIDFWGLILVVLSLIFKIKVNSKNGKEILRKIHRNEINELKIEREIYEFINFGIKEFVLI